VTTTKIKYISTTGLSKTFGLSSKELFTEFQKLGLITPERTLTAEGIAIGGIYKEMKKDGEVIKYIAWPNDIDFNISSNNESLITATVLGKSFELSAQKINFILSEIGWAKKGDLKKGWVATSQGLKIGALQSEDPKSGVPFIRWPKSIIGNKALISTIKDLKGTTEPIKASVNNETVEFREDFYIPTGKVYIEFWGYENDSKYLHRKKIKQDIYKKYNLNLIELDDKDVQNLDDILPRLLLKYGVQTY